MMLMFIIALPVSKALSHLNRALGYKGRSIHPGGIAHAQSMPVNCNHLQKQLVDHPYHDLEGCENNDKYNYTDKNVKIKK